MADFSIEESISGPVIGLDEVGRGPLAGPVVSCGVLFKSYKKLNEKILITDSKKLTKKQRNKLFLILRNLKNQKLIDYHLGMASVNEIDNLNILQATKLSMKRVINKFKLNNVKLIIDGNFAINYKHFEERNIIGGDNLSISIAAASIIAKTHRDRLMSILNSKFNFFGWDKNSGYGTNSHLEAIKKFGYTIHHRKSFEPIKSLAKKNF